MKKIKRAPVTILIAFALTGCFKPDKIEETKELTYDYVDSTLTLGQALDTRNMCKEALWGTSVDERQREVVNYSCDLNGIGGIYARWNDEATNLYLESNRPRLEELKQDADTARKTAALYKKYFTIVERLDKQNVIAALARVKKFTPAITKMSRFAFDPSDDRATAIGIPHEVIDSFTIGSRLYTKELSDKTYGADFVVEYFSTFMMNDFEELLDGFNEGTPIADLIAAQKVKVASIDDDAAEAKSKADTLAYQFSKEGIAYRRQHWEMNQPIRVVQHLTFIPAKPNPLSSCEFDFYTPASKENVAYKKVITDVDICLKEAYESEYSQFYIDMFRAVYDEQKGQ